MANAITAQLQTCNVRDYMQFSYALGEYTLVSARANLCWRNQRGITDLTPRKIERLLTNAYSTSHTRAGKQGKMLYIS